LSKRNLCVSLCVVSLAITFVTVFASGAFAQACADITSCNFSSLNGILLVDGVKHKSLAAAIAACPQTCWIIDNFPEKLSANPFLNIGNKSVKVTLGRGTWITDTTIVVPTKSQLEGSGRGDRIGLRTSGCFAGRHSSRPHRHHRRRPRTDPALHR